jgi:hypothetical protein
MRQPRFRTAVCNSAPILTNPPFDERGCNTRCCDVAYLVPFDVPFRARNFSLMPVKLTPNTVLTREKCFENALGNVGSAFKNLRLGSINLVQKIMTSQPSATHPLFGTNLHLPQIQPEFVVDSFYELSEMSAWTTLSLF